MNREQRRAAGLCTECGVNVPRANYVTCFNCAQRRAGRKDGKTRKSEKGIAVCMRMVDFIEAYAAREQRPPTVREIADGVGLKSKSTVFEHMKWLRDEKMIEWKEDAVRTLRVTRKR